MAKDVIKPDPIDTGLEAEVTTHDFIYTPPPAEVEETTYTPNPQILQDTAQTSLIEPGVSERMITTAKAGDVVPYVFGHCLVKPLIYTVVDKGNGSIAVDFIISQGVCETVDKVVQDGVVYDVSDSPSSTLVANWEFYEGTASQIASPKIGAALGSPNTYDTLDGICHVVADVNQWTSFDVKFVMRGIICRDPRTSPQLGSTATSNVALILARVLEDSGFTLNETALIDSANFCDAVTGSPALPRWTVDLPIYNRKSLYKWVHTLASYGSLLVDYRGSEVYLIPDRAVTTSPQITHTVTATDIQNPRTTHLGISQVPEKVFVDYREPDGETGTATAGSGSSGRITRLRMPGYGTFTMASRRAEEVLAKQQSAIKHEHSAYAQSLSSTIGDLADITYAPHNLSSERMRLIDQQQTSLGKWRRTYRQYSDSLYSSDTFTPSTPGTNPPTEPPGEIPTGPCSVLTQETFTGGNGYERIKVEFIESSWPHVLGYVVVVGPSSGGAGGAQTVYSGFIPHTGDGTQTVYTDPIVIADDTVSPVVAAVEYKAWVFIYASTGLGAACTTLFTPSDPNFAVTAKQFGPGNSPDNYYTIGGGSPHDYRSFITGTSSGDSYVKMTLVFCVHPNIFDWHHIFCSANANIAVAISDTDGGLWVSRKDATNAINSIDILPSGSPTDNGGMNLNAWNQVMIAYDGSIGSPLSLAAKIWINGVEMYSGDWGSGVANTHPMSWAGPSYVGKGELNNGLPNPALDCYVSYVWCAEEYLDPDVYWDSFFDGTGKPLDIGTDGSNVSGSPPLVPDTYCKNGDFTANAGSGDNWTEVGTVPDAPSSPTD